MFNEITAHFLSPKIWEDLSIHKHSCYTFKNHTYLKSGHMLYYHKFTCKGMFTVISIVEVLWYQHIIQVFRDNLCLAPSPHLINSPSDNIHDGRWLHLYLYWYLRELLRKQQEYHGPQCSPESPWPLCSSSQYCYPF